MKVEEFIKGYNKIVEANGSVKDYILARYKVQYVPFRKKVSVCENIVNVSMHNDVHTILGETKSILHSDQASRYMLFMLSLIDLYTDIDINFEDGSAALDEYEAMDELDLIQLLIVGEPMVEEAGISIVEYERFKMILDMKIDDLRINEASIINYLDRKFDAFGVVANTILESVINVFQDSIGKEFSEMTDEEKKQIIKDITDKFSN